MGLSFVAPTIIEGTPTTCLEKVEIEKLNVKWENVLFVYIVGQPPTMNAMNALIKSKWGVSADSTVHRHDHGYFVVNLVNRGDKDSILYSGPHLFYGKTMIIQQWTSSFDFHKEVQKVIPILVMLPNLPLNCWSENSLSRIGSLLGVPIYADDCTTKILRVSFARFLVEMDVSKVVPKEIQIEDPNGRKFTQKVVIDWLPAFCIKCQFIGNNCDAKTARPPTKPTQKWVLKKIIVVNEPKGNAATETQDDHVTGSLVMSVDSGCVGPSNTVGDPPLAAKVSNEITPVSTHVQQQNVEEEEPWEVVTRKSKGKQVAYQLMRGVSYSLWNSTHDLGRPGVLRNPIYHDVIQCLEC